MKKLWALGGAVLLAGTIATAAWAASSATGSSTRVRGGDDGGIVVVDWNTELLRIVRTPGAQPATVHPTRSFAIMHAAIYDAVVSVLGGAHPYAVSVKAPRDARADAAAAAAGHDTLAALYPGMKAQIDAFLTAELAGLPVGAHTDEGLRVGRAVAGRLLALRRGDGSAALPPPLPAASEPGAFRPTPPKFAPAPFTHWSAVTPFVLARSSQFRPVAPPPVTSMAYANALNEVKNVGRDASTARTADQTAAATFWSAPIWNYWNEIAGRAAYMHHASLLTTARLFAVMNISFADDVIAFYDAKYHFALWRPITAIREADTDGNPNTAGDPTWTPLAPTPADPSYPGAHSAISATGAAILDSFFGDRDHVRVTSELVPGAVRAFTGYQAAATEAGLSRIYAGVHTRVDHDAGLELGRRVAAFVLRRSTSPQFGPAPPRAEGSR